jgi:histidinol dehydrogenase
MALPSLRASEHRHPAGRLVYPVLSRRSGGLSLGIELFPQGKDCSFDCPYCEVFPSSGGLPFSVQRLEAELEAFLEGYAKQPAGGAGRALPPVRDICISGSGEPSLSPFLGEALAAAARFRAAHRGLLSGARLVLITNSTGFLRPGISSLLAEYAASEGLDIWAKLDAGSQAWFEAMSGTKLQLESIVSGIEGFASATPIAIQTMACRLGERSPDGAELAAYSGILSRLGAAGARVSEVQLYTQARPCPGSLSSALTDAELSRIAQRVISASPFPLRVFGSGGELEV